MLHWLKRLLGYKYCTCGDIAQVKHSITGTPRCWPCAVLNEWNEDTLGAKADGRSLEECTALARERQELGRELMSIL